MSEGRTVSVQIDKAINYSVNAASSDATQFKTLKELESQHILKVLKHCSGKVRGEDGAATILDIKPTTLESRMKKLGIKKEYVLSSR